MIAYGSEALSIDPVKQPECADAKDDFRTAVVEGLSSAQKRIHCKFLYDQRGSELFEAITRLPEYYLTRIELSLLTAFRSEISDAVGEHCLVVEYGSGSALKTQLLLDCLHHPAGYIPVDISAEQLYSASTRIASAFPKLEVQPVHADYTADFPMPHLGRRFDRTLVFFPGSSIGNFHPTAAQAFLSDARRRAGAWSDLLIGIDLKKDSVRLHRAYNDSAGITAEFNRNLLVRMNCELDADIELDSFAHYAPYVPSLSRIEMHLVSRFEQTVRVAGRWFHFDAGESIHTENSYKYSTKAFSALAFAAGYKLRRVWTDSERQFGVHLFSAI